MARLNKLLGKLTQTPEELRSEELKRWAATVPSVTPLGEAPSRERVKVVGVVESIRIDPREGSGSIEATLCDGTGEIVARWLGRQSLSGIRLGAALAVEGILGEGSEGKRVVLNPEYHLIEGPAAG
ncbi:MAG: hypothetical protein QOK47_1296 [Actinomycetota bacterium]|nr:hypothetical protein [Actinomycetota bacterium]